MEDKVYVWGSPVNEEVKRTTIKMILEVTATIQKSKTVRKRNVDGKSHKSTSAKKLKF